MGLGLVPHLEIIKSPLPPRWSKGRRAGDNASKMLSTAPGTARAQDQKLLTLLAVVVWSWQQRGPAPREEAPPTGTGLRPQAGDGSWGGESPLLPISANSETSNDQDAVPGGIPCPSFREEKGSETKLTSLRKVALGRGLWAVAMGRPAAFFLLSLEHGLLSQRDL